MDKHNSIPGTNMWKHLLKENINYVKKYETYESQDFQNKNFSLDSYFCSKVEPNSVTVNDLADMQLKADDVSPDIWHPFLPEIVIDTAPYTTNWSKMKFFTANKEILSNLLLVKDYTTVAKILYAVFKRVNQFPIINTELVKQMNPDLLFILMWNQSVLVRFMTVRLIRLLLGDEEMQQNLFHAKIYVGLWEVYKEEADPILLSDVLKCLSCLAMKFKYVIAYLMNHNAPDCLFGKLFLADVNTKAALYQLMEIIATECAENRKEFLDMDEEEMEAVLFDSMNGLSITLREKTLCFLDGIFECGSELHQFLISNNILDELIRITMSIDDVTCHRTAFSLIGKIVCAEDLHYQCMYFKHGRKKLIREMFLYFKGTSVLKCDILTALIEAISKIAKINSLYYRVILERGFMDILGNILQREAQMENSLMLAVCSGFETVVQSIEGLDTAVAYNPVLPLCKIILGEKRSQEVKIAALKALSSIICNDSDLRSTALLTLEPQIDKFFTDLEPHSLNKTFLEFLFSCGEELNGLQPETLNLLTEYLYGIVDFQRNGQYNLSFIGTVYATITCIIKSIPDVAQVLASNRNDEFIMEILMQENMDVPFIDTMLNYYCMAFSINQQYIVKMLDTNMLEWLCENKKLQSVTGSIERALNYLLDADVVLKFHLTGELTFTDIIPDGFFTHIYWPLQNETEDVTSDKETMIPVLYFNVGGLPKGPSVHSLTKLREAYTSRLKRYLQLSKLTISIAGEVDREVRKSAKKSLACKVSQSREAETVTTGRLVNVFTEASSILFAAISQDISKTSKNPGGSELRVHVEHSSSYDGSQAVRIISSMIPVLWPSASENLIQSFLQPDTDVAVAIDIVSRNIEDYSLEYEVFEKAKVIQYIAEDVDLMMGRKEGTNCPKCIKHRADEILDAAESNFIPLGKVIGGSKLERSLLFKLMADRLEVPCAIKRISMYIAWVEVLVENKEKTMLRYIVDLIENIGALIPVGSPEAGKYTKDEYTCTVCHTQQEEVDPSKLFDRKAFISDEKTVVHDIEPKLYS